MGFGVGLGILGVASIGAAFLLRPKAPHTKTEGPRLNELTSTTSQYGIGIPRVWGAYTVPGNVIWAGDVNEHVKKTTSSSGGKGGGKAKSTHTDYSYTLSIAVGLASAHHRPIKRVLRILMDNKVVYDITGGSIDQEVKGLFWRFYNGSEEQEPDSIIADAVGWDNAPAYRGLSYVVFDELPITEFGNRIPQMKFLIESEGEGLCVNKPFEVTGTFGIDDIVADFKSGKAAATWTLDGVYNLVIQSTRTQKVIARKRLDDIEGRSYRGAIGFGERGIAVIGAYDGGIYSRTRLELWDLNTLTRKRTTSVNNGHGGGGETITVGEYVSALDGKHRTIACVTHSTMNIGYRSWRPMEVVDVENSEDPILIGRAFHDGREVFDLTYAHSYFSHKGNYGTSTEFYWLHADGSVTTRRSDRMILNLLEVKDKLETGMLGFSIYPEASVSRVLTLKLTDIDPEGRIKSFYSAMDAGFASQLGQGNCIVDAIIPCADGGFIVSACSQAFTIRYNASGHVLWRFTSDESYAWSDNPFSDSFSPVKLHSFRAGSTIAVRGRKNGVLGNYTVDVMTGEPLSFCQGYSSGSINYDALTQSFILDAGVTYLDMFDAGRVHVSTVIDDLSAEVGVKNSDYNDIASLTINGYMQAKPTSPKEMITPLANIFSFDAVESGGHLNWVKRGKEPLKTYTPEEMVMLSGQRDGSAVQVSRKEDIAIPQAVTVTYSEEETNHEPNFVSRQRFKGNEGYDTMRSQNKMSLEAPVAISADQAKQAADVILMGLWNGRNEYKLRLPRNELQLDVGDVITVSVLGQFPEDVYIDKISVGADLQIEIEGSSEDSSQYTSLAEGSVSEGFISFTIEEPKQTRLYLLPIPYLQDTNDTQGRSLLVYYAEGAYDDGWRGGRIDRLTSSGSFEETGLQPTPATHGVLAAPMPIATYYDVFATNEDISIELAVTRGQVESVAYEDILDGANALAVLYSTNEAEVLQFRDAELLENGNYLLTGIVRGQRGTDWLATAKPAPIGSEVVFLSEGSVNAVQLDMNKLGDVEIFRGYSSSQAPEDGDTRGIKVGGYEYMPWAPVHLSADVQVGGDIEVTWIRRTRLNGGLHDDTSNVPVGEEQEKYEIDVLIGNEVVRTLVSSSENVTYTIAQRIEDGTDVLSGSIEFHVYQISSMVGRGYKGIVSTKGIDLLVGQVSAGLLYKLGQPDYMVAQHGAIVLQGTVINYRVAQSSTVVLHDSMPEPLHNVAQQGNTVMYTGDFEPLHNVAQQINIVLHEE